MLCRELLMLCFIIPLCVCGHSPWCWYRCGPSGTLSDQLVCPTWPIVPWPSSSAVCSSGCGRRAVCLQVAASAPCTTPETPVGSPCMSTPAQSYQTGHGAGTLPPPPLVRPPSHPTTISLQLKRHSGRERIKGNQYHFEF